MVHFQNYAIESSLDKKKNNAHEKQYHLTLPAGKVIEKGLI